MNVRHPGSETVFVVLLCLCAGAGAAVIQVPGDAPTIQAGIDLAIDGVDEVVVADGLYAGKGNTNLSMPAPAHQACLDASF